MRAPAESPSGTQARAITRKPAHVIPKANAPHLTLMTAMAAMCFLATLAISALLMTNTAVEGWTSQIASEVTVQIKAIDGIDQAEETEKAMTILRQTKGVADADLLDRAAAIELLKPWLGDGSALDDLPVPRLITVRVDPKDPPDFEALRTALTAEVPSALLDTHRRWQGELISMADSLLWLALAVLALIAAAASLLVVYATRAAIEANREVIEVLYLAGARDSFIAREVLWRFCLTGLKAGLIGALGGLATLGALSLSSTGIALPATALLSGPYHGNSVAYMAILAVPVVATLISLLTARIAISRVLKAMF